LNTIVHSETVDFEVVGEGVKRKILSYNDTIMGVEVHFEKGGVGSVHTHPHTQMTYVLEGTFEFSLDDKLVKVSKGDTLLFESNVKHGTVCLEKGVLLDIFTPYRKDFIDK